ncbi:MAG: hypothetical protein DHS20C15_06440 [Planctomycetota bacterium]|nr:MAG: hypothetical protein DHS20C15_06440 [Planctomycetota bacterium]
MIPLFLHLLRRQLGLLITLALFFAATEIVFVQILESIQAEGGIGKLADALPGFVQNILQHQLGEMTGRAALGGFFRDPALIVPLLAVIVLAGTQLRADRESGLSDLYLARPLSRRSQLLTHLLNTWVPALVLPAAILLGLGLGLNLASIDNAPPFAVYVIAGSGLITLMMFFGALTLWLSTGEARRGSVVTRVAGVAVIGFLLEVVGTLWAPAALLRCFGPFFYFHPVGVLDAYNDASAPALDLQSMLVDAQPLFPQPGPGLNTLVLLGFTVLFLALAFRRFERRDL